jgi:hypothetical protein
MNTIRKAIAQLLTGVVTWATAVTLSEPSAVTSSEWVVALGLGVGAFLVWLTPNSPDVNVNIDEALLPYDDVPSTRDRGAVAWGTVALVIIAVVAVFIWLGVEPPH